MPLSKQAGQIAPPVTACPTKTLLEELGVVLEGGLYFTLGVVLHVCLVTMGHHPPGEEVVVVGIELIMTKPPLLIREAVGEVDVLQDTCTVGTSTSREARDPAVHVSGGCTVEIAAFQVESTQESIDALGKAGVLGSPESLTGDDSSILFILEGGQHPLQRFDGPRDIVVGKENDFGGDFWDGPGHLTSLVCLLDRRAANAFMLGRRHLRHGSLCLVQILVDGDQDQFLWLVLQDRGNCPLQFFALTVQGGQDDRDVRGKEGRVFWNWDGLESPECPQVDDETDIAPEAALHQPAVRALHGKATHK